MQTLKYTNEFLKNFEPVIEKHDLELLGKIKNTLNEIAQSGIFSTKLENTKSYSGSDVFLTEVKESKYNIFWTEENSQKYIVSVIKSK